MNRLFYVNMAHMQTIKEFMQNDHKRLDELFEKFKNFKDKDQTEARKYFCPFRRGLFSHIELEEKILFPIFEEKTGMKDGGPTAVMRAEHIEIKEFLNQIREKIHSGDFNTGRIEKELIEVLSGHNEKEENILYPWIDQSIEESDRKKIFDKIKEIAAPNTCGCAH